MHHAAAVHLGHRPGQLRGKLDLLADGEQGRPLSEARVPGVLHDDRVRVIRRVDQLGDPRNAAEPFEHRDLVSEPVVCVRSQRLLADHRAPGYSEARDARAVARVDELASSALNGRHQRSRRHGTRPHRGANAQSRPRPSGRCPRAGGRHPCRSPRADRQSSARAYRCPGGVATRRCAKDTSVKGGCKADHLRRLKVDHPGGWSGPSKQWSVSRRRWAAISTPRSPRGPLVAPLSRERPSGTLAFAGLTRAPHRGHSRSARWRAAVFLQALTEGMLRARLAPGLLPPTGARRSSTLLRGGSPRVVETVGETGLARAKAIDASGVPAIGVLVPLLPTRIEGDDRARRPTCWTKRDARGLMGRTSDAPPARDVVTGVLAMSSPGSLPSPSGSDSWRSAPGRRPPVPPCALGIVVCNAVGDRGRALRDKVPANVQELVSVQSGWGT
jgi:hypothetical protein